MDVNNVNLYNTSPTFKSMSGTKATCMFRCDTPWHKAPKYFSEVFKDYDKVNFEVWGCSDGSEVWSWILALKKYLPDSWTKFMKIKASDMDPNMINRAKTLPCKLDYVDINCIKNITDNNYLGYFYREESHDYTYGYAASPKPILKDNAIFEISKVEDNVKKLDPNIPNIISCKNTMIYMKRDIVDQSIKTLSEKNGKPLLLSIGDYDVEYDIDKILKKYGFKESKDAWHIYEKAD